MAKLSDLHNAIVKGSLELAVSTTQEALQENIDPQTLISDYLIKGMEEIGTQFEAGKAYVPNLLMSARAMKGALELLKPYMENDKNEKKIVPKTEKMQGKAGQKTRQRL